jgi:hypothetical protein
MALGGLAILACRPTGGSGQTQGLELELGRGDLRLSLLLEAPSPDRPAFRRSPAFNLSHRRETPPDSPAAVLAVDLVCQVLTAASPKQFPWLPVAP